ncbi:hypothetical protein WICPIJ_009931 [Wickerhamomyces pijperi]|uniref:Uncharacterized protein n=1 Tax=Wickerhamomyces pijperi TaxID=599730 RepID=A0A9P8PK78_WICPI|nr:hypothetical protein WICPIJ_009931 [Wickerhamomyces pijperi]
MLESSYVESDSCELLTILERVGFLSSNGSFSLFLMLEVEDTDVKDSKEECEDKEEMEEVDDLLDSSDLSVSLVGEGGHGNRTDPDLDADPGLSTEAAEAGVANKEFSSLSALLAFKFNKLLISDSVF